MRVNNINRTTLVFYAGCGRAWLVKSFQSPRWYGWIVLSQALKQGVRIPRSMRPYIEKAKQRKSWELTDTSVRQSKQGGKCEGEE